MREVTIPSKTFTTCSGCQYYKSTLIRSGRDPKRTHNCAHTKNKQDSISSIFGLCQSNLDYVDGYPITPDWCPLKNN